MKKRDATKSFILRAPAEFLTRLKQRASESSQSANRLCITLLEKGLESHAVGNLDPYPKLTELVEHLQVRYGSFLMSVILYGSFARGEQRPSSDIDVLAVLSEAASLDRDSYEGLPVLKHERHDISIMVAKFPSQGQAVSPFWYEIALDGFILFDLNFEMSRFLAAVRRKISSGAVRRTSSYGVGYWESLGGDEDR